MALPVRTPEERAADLLKAVAVRKERADLKDKLKKGQVTLAEALKAAETSDVIARTRVVEMLKSMPGVGKARAKTVMDRLGIKETRRAGGLSSRQRAALEEMFAPLDA